MKTFKQFLTEDLLNDTEIEMTLRHALKINQKDAEAIRLWLLTWPAMASNLPPNLFWQLYDWVGATGGNVRNAVAQKLETNFGITL